MALANYFFIFSTLSIFSALLYLLSAPLVMDNLIPRFQSTAMEPSLTVGHGTEPVVPQERRLS